MKSDALTVSVCLCVLCSVMTRTQVQTVQTLFKCEKREPECAPAQQGIKISAGRLH